MATDSRKLTIGVGLLVLCSALVIFGGLPTAPIPDVALAVAALGLAAGSLLVGFSEDGIGV
ncbi:hypothetical protein ACFQPA_08330 [Halomarina halobia]|uniref:Uncharacterized protein n=1 Tax=Halomarina halobia TaxID=3033386 RepID=A0ABD6AC47_9EURY|nr:hypothetical protein [Halomarina sp. PSR21]